ncbi:hypothetical protein TRFO_01203 [Tritrichomonas foetus]|uniref:Protein kinase domain-containing protein n=1 Tax=Tritrichomonas foetus TaxID=1144522 RepID=A0A1J4KJG7_9EUKA|nr:hypothetical protein TRFO_01203 [Tritrichomonas foetus]|eukprot:OHT11242.1 hypothetical protein TRFO_01203 [Tritrichomonas foetus]
MGKNDIFVVWTGMDTRTNKKVVIKEFVKFTDNKERKMFLRESYLLSLTNNKFIIPFIGYTVDHPYAIITEYIPNGNLSILIHGDSDKNSEKKHFSSTYKSIIAMSIAFAMSHVHSLNIIHRDLKPSTVLIEANGTPRIAGFGFARFEDTIGTMTRRIGTPAYMSPEIIKDFYYSMKTDIYSFGVLLYEMSENHHPYPFKTTTDIYDEVVDGDLRPNFSRSTSFGLQRYISKCWSSDAHKRPTFDQIFNDFANGKISFSSSDRSVIKNAADKLRKYHLKSETQGKIPPLVFVDLQQVYLKLQQQKDPTFNVPKEKKIESNTNNIEADKQKEITVLKPIPKINMSNILKKASMQTIAVSQGFIGKNEQVITSALPPATSIKKTIETENLPDLPTFSKILSPSMKQSIKTSKFEDCQTEGNVFHNSETQNDITKSTTLVNLKFNFDQSLLMDVLNPKFIPYINQIADNLPPNYYDEYLIVISKIFKFLANESKVEVLKSFFIIGCRDVTFIDHLINSDLIQDLKINGLETVLQMTNLYYFFFTQRKNFLMNPLIHSNLPFLIKTCPEDMIILLSYYTQKIPNIEQSLPVLDLFLKETSIFLQLDCANHFISIFYHLCIKSPEYLNRRQNDVLAQFEVLTRSQNVIIINEAYKGITNLYDPKYLLNFDIIINNFENDTLHDIICSLLLRVEKFPPSRRLANFFIDKSRVSEEWFLVLMKFSECSTETAKVVVHNQQWMNFGIPTYVNNYKLFLILFQSSLLRKTIVTQHSFYYLLLLFLESNDRDILRSFDEIAKKAPLTKDVLIALEKGKFLKRYFLKLYEETDSEMLAVFVNFFHELAKIGYVNSYEIAITKLIYLIKSNPELSSSIIHTLIQISALPEAVPILKMRKMDAYFQMLKTIQGYEAYAQSFLSNIEKNG